MKIELSRLSHVFLDKPLLIGGKAMEYYGLRKAGADIDFVVSSRDHDCLCSLYPDAIKDLYGDIGVCVHGFEIWNQICRFRYEFLRQNALEEDEWLVASTDKLILLKAIAMHIPKYMEDLRSLVKYAADVQYERATLPQPRGSSRPDSPLFQNIDCLMLNVEDIDAALLFYRDKLGLPLVWRTETSLGLRVGESELVLHQGKRTEPETDIMVASADEAARRFVAAGGSIVRGPFDIKIGKCLVVADPWGNKLVLLDCTKGLLKTSADGYVID
jgi:catechol 2,3-dioxygenase-like lactoylglutathione lyase family enzyme